MTPFFDNSDHPRFIYGTAWKEEKTKKLTGLALESGFRAIDTANQRKHYVEAAVGEAIDEAIEEKLVEREELFVQTKFTYAAGQDHRIPYDPDAPFADQVEQSFQRSLEHLNIEFVDSYILHGPSTRAGLGEADHKVWQAMEKLATSDRVGMIGISNVTANQLQILIDDADVAPAFVQNRCFARNGWDRQIRQICRANDITYQGFSLLTANQRELNSAQITELAENHDITVPQLVFRFAQQIGMVPLTGTTSRKHMEQDLVVSDFELTNSELETIENIAGR